MANEIKEELNISDFVKNDNKVYFVFYRNQIMYYRVKKNKSTIYYQFPVPLEDIGNATLENVDKAITFMRYIRKAIDEGTLNIIF